MLQTTLNFTKVVAKENGNDIALVRLPKPAYTMFEIVWIALFVVLFKQDALLHTHSFLF